MAALAETWLSCAERTLVLFDLAVEHWDAKLEKGKSVGSQFAHLCLVRRMWVEPSAGKLGVELSKFSGRHPGAEEVRAALVETGEAVAALLRAAEPVDGKGFGMKGGATKFLGYLCAHEAYHWAQVDLALRQAGVPIDEKSMYGLWEWGS